jgi:hypothetical protein
MEKKTRLCGDPVRSTGESYHIDVFEARKACL